ncbi:coiled-coil domain-containing protein R3HCC1L-like [Liolophura sinensis]|uniref:coiled-coil domain-containing protein R3HCC1L-like n=1 Tax=Liolophura sinensis TaxID=3198878 RepID=UPI0031584328
MAENLTGKLSNDVITTTLSETRDLVIVPAQFYTPSVEQSHEGDRNRSISPTDPVVQPEACRTNQAKHNLISPHKEVAGSDFANSSHEKETSTAEDYSKEVNREITSSILEDHSGQTLEKGDQKDNNSKLANLCQEVLPSANHCDIHKRAPSLSEPASHSQPPDSELPSSSQSEESSFSDQCGETSSARGTAQCKDAEVNHNSVAMETFDDEEEEDSWDKLFTDDGDCLDPKIMEELTSAVGSVQVEKPQAQNYYKYQPKEPDVDLEAYDHVIEISEFPVEFLTRDLIAAFQPFISRGFDIKWVDDTHALGIFSSAIAARDALQMQHPMLKVRALSEADKQCKLKAKRCVEFLQPYKARPQTSASAARRLVTGALGLAPRVSKEKREQERQQLREAKARRQQDRRNKDDAWEGNYGKCAMDEEGS